MSYQVGYRSILFAQNGRVLTVTLNRPDTMNAIDAALHEELSRLFSDIKRDRSVDVIILTGAGRAFCAGGDLTWMQDAIDDPGNFEIVADEARWIISSMLDCDKPIVCRMNGDAVGLGATIALFSDIIVAVETARIGDPHVSVGLVAGDGGTVIWPQLIGYAKAKEFLLLGGLASATEAERIGLINHCVPVADLDAKVDELATKLAAGATKAIRWTKRAINLPLKQVAITSMDAAISYESLSNLTRDHAEAVDAFRSRRKPMFLGK